MSKRTWLFSAGISLIFVHVFAWYVIPVEFYLRHADSFETTLSEMANTSLRIGLASFFILLAASYFVFLRVRKPAAMIFIALAATFWIVYSLFGHNDPTIDLNFERVDLERSRAVIESGIFALLATLLLIFRKLLPNLNHTFD